MGKGPLSEFVGGGLKNAYKRVFKKGAKEGAEKTAKEGTQKATKEAVQEGVEQASKKSQNIVLRAGKKVLSGTKKLASATLTGVVGLMGSLLGAIPSLLSNIFGAGNLSNMGPSQGGYITGVGGGGAEKKRDDGVRHNAQKKKRKLPKEDETAKQDIREAKARQMADSQKTRGLKSLSNELTSLSDRSKNIMKSYGLNSNNMKSSNMKSNIRSNQLQIKAPKIGGMEVTEEKPANFIDASQITQLYKQTNDDPRLDRIIELIQASNELTGITNEQLSKLVNEGIINAESDKLYGKVLKDLADRDADAAVSMNKQAQDDIHENNVEELLSELVASSGESGLIGPFGGVPGKEGSAKKTNALIAAGIGAALPMIIGAVSKAWGGEDEDKTEDEKAYEQESQDKLGQRYTDEDSNEAKIDNALETGFEMYSHVDNYRDALKKKNELKAAEIKAETKEVNIENKEIDEKTKDTKKSNDSKSKGNDAAKEQAKKNQQKTQSKKDKSKTKQLKKGPKNKPPKPEVKAPVKATPNPVKAGGELARTSSVNNLGNSVAKNEAKDMNTLMKKLPKLEQFIAKTGGGFLGAKAAVKAFGTIMKKIPALGAAFSVADVISAIDDGDYATATLQTLAGVASIAGGPVGMAAALLIDGLNGYMRNEHIKRQEELQSAADRLVHDPQSIVMRLLEGKNLNEFEAPFKDIPQRILDFYGGINNMNLDPSEVFEKNAALVNLEKYLPEIEDWVNKNRNNNKRTGKVDNYSKPVKDRVNALNNFLEKYGAHLNYFDDNMQKDDKIRLELDNKTFDLELGNSGRKKDKDGKVVDMTDAEKQKWIDDHGSWWDKTKKGSKNLANSMWQGTKNFVGENVVNKAKSAANWTMDKAADYGSRAVGAVADTGKSIFNAGARWMFGDKAIQLSQGTKKVRDYSIAMSNYALGTRAFTGEIPHTTSEGTSEVIQPYGGVPFISEASGVPRFSNQSERVWPNLTAYKNETGEDPNKLRRIKVGQKEDFSKGTDKIGFKLDPVLHKYAEGTKFDYDAFIKDYEKASSNLDHEFSNKNLKEFFDVPERAGLTSSESRAFSYIFNNLKHGELNKEGIELASMNSTDFQNLLKSGNFVELKERLYSQLTNEVMDRIGQSLNSKYPEIGELMRLTESRLAAPLLKSMGLIADGDKVSLKLDPNTFPINPDVYSIVYSHLIDNLKNIRSQSNDKEDSDSIRLKLANSIKSKDDELDIFSDRTVNPRQYAIGTPYDYLPDEPVKRFAVGTSNLVSLSAPQFRSVFDSSSVGETVNSASGSNVEAKDLSNYNTQISWNNLPDTNKQYKPFDISKANSMMNRVTPDSTYGQYKHKCAKYVRFAIESGFGLPSGGLFKAANDLGIGDLSYARYYGNLLPKMGFKPIEINSDYKPQAGDIAVYEKPGNPNHPGHICYYNGKNWKSDTTQRTWKVYGGKISKGSIFRNVNSINIPQNTGFSQGTPVNEGLNNLLDQIKQYAVGTSNLVSLSAPQFKGIYDTASYTTDSEGNPENQGDPNAGSSDINNNLDISSINGKSTSQISGKFKNNDDGKKAFVSSMYKGWKETGVPDHIAVALTAQSAMESGYGTSSISASSNYGGIIRHDGLPYAAGSNRWAGYKNMGEYINDKLNSVLKKNFPDSLKATSIGGVYYGLQHGVGNRAYCGTETYGGVTTTRDTYAQNIVNGVLPRVQSYLGTNFPSYINETQAHAYNGTPFVTEDEINKITGIFNGVVDKDSRSQLVKDLTKEGVNKATKWADDKLANLTNSGNKVIDKVTDKINDATNINKVFSNVAKKLKETKDKVNILPSKSNQKVSTKSMEVKATTVNLYGNLGASSLINQGVKVIAEPIMDEVINGSKLPIAANYQNNITATPLPQVEHSVDAKKDKAEVEEKMALLAKVVSPAASQPVINNNKAGDTYVTNNNRGGDTYHIHNYGKNQDRLQLEGS